MSSLEPKPGAPSPPVTRERPGIVVKPLPALLVLLLTCAAAGYTIYRLIRAAHF